MDIDNRSPISIILSYFQGHFHPFKSHRFKPFKCQAYVLNQDASKLQRRAKQMVMVGFEPGSNAYCFWDKSSQKIVISSDVKFDETCFPATRHASTPTMLQINDIFPDLPATISINEYTRAQETHCPVDEPRDDDTLDFRL